MNILGTLVSLVGVAPLCREQGGPLLVAPLAELLANLKPTDSAAPIAIETAVQDLVIRQLPPGQQAVEIAHLASQLEGLFLTGVDVVALERLTEQLDELRVLASALHSPFFGSIDLRLTPSICQLIRRITLRNSSGGDVCIVLSGKPPSDLPLPQDIGYTRFLKVSFDPVRRGLKFSWALSGTLNGVNSRMPFSVHEHDLRSVRAELNERGTTKAIAFVESITTGSFNTTLGSLQLSVSSDSNRTLTVATITSAGRGPRVTIVRLP